MNRTTTASAKTMGPAMLMMALLLAAGAALADDVRFYRLGEAPAPADVARMLRSGPVDANGMPAKTRGIRLLPDASEPQATQRKEIERIAGEPARESGGAFALQVQFPFDSAEIQFEMLAPLDAVAEGIRAAGPGASVVIEGHTDATGSAEYNLGLSRRRAESVKNYLVLRHGLPADGFRVVGKGEYDPLLRDKPYAAENRRVQFRAGA